MQQCMAYIPDVLHTAAAIHVNDALSYVSNQHVLACHIINIEVNNV